MIFKVYFAGVWLSFYIFYVSFQVHGKMHEETKHHHHHHKNLENHHSHHSLHSKLHSNHQSRNKTIPRTFLKAITKAHYMGRVIGGMEARVNEFPWQAAINKAGTRSNSGTFCGGTLINDRYVLTAAHCVIVVPTGPKSPDSIEVILHMHDRELSDSRENSLRVAVDEIIVHPKYTTFAFESNGNAAYLPMDNDIALLRLSNSVAHHIESRGIEALCLPKNNQTYSYNEGQRFITAGWGLTQQNGRYGSNVLKKVDLTLTSMVDCYKFFILIFGTENALRADRFFCAQGKKSLEGIAQGDSGGSLLHKEGNVKYRQVGVTSMTQYEKGGVSASIFFNINLRMPWIRKEMKMRDPKLRICA